MRFFYLFINRIYHRHNVVEQWRFYTGWISNIQSSEMWLKGNGKVDECHRYAIKSHV